MSVLRWSACLVACLVMEVLAVLLAPVLPLFAASRLGWSDNRNQWAEEPRLPRWLAWFDTPDNSLLGDGAHRSRHAGSPFWWQATCWLARNRAYGFKWSVLAARVDVRALTYTGDPRVNRNNGITGVFRATMGDFWEYKVVRRLVGDYGVMFDFGWLLNAYCLSPEKAAEQPFALFQFSPRIVRIRRAGS